MQGGIVGMTDRYGNALTLARDLSTGNLNRIVSPSGRWINFSYDTAGRITQAQDNSGRTVSYSYDSGGRLNKVIDANGGTLNDQFCLCGRQAAATPPIPAKFRVSAAAA
jgi:YD repeat-containing protein